MKNSFVNVHIGNEKSVNNYEWCVNVLVDDTWYVPRSKISNFTKFPFTLKGGFIFLNEIEGLN